LLTQDKSTIHAEDRRTDYRRDREHAEMGVTSTTIPMT